MTVSCSRGSLASKEFLYGREVTNLYLERITVQVINLYHGRNTNNQFVSWKKYKQSIYIMGEIHAINLYHGRKISNQFIPQTKETSLYMKKKPQKKPM